MKPQSLDLVVVTGAGSGIGRAVAIAFAAEGALVIATDISEETAIATATQIVATGGRAVAYRLDVSDAVQFQEVADRIRDEHGIADVIVNNAGIATVGAALDVEPTAWDKVIGVNLMGVVYGCRLFGRQMADRGRGGHIVNIASLAAFSPSPAFAPYCTTKAAVRMLSDCLRVEFREHGIGVTAICPGGIKTAIYTNATHVGIDAEAGARRSEFAGSLTERLTALGLFSPPEHVAKIVLRSVRHNWATVPVRPEAWAAYLTSRVSPGLLRLFSKAVTSTQAIEYASHAADTRVGKQFLRLRH